MRSRTGASPRAHVARILVGSDRSTARGSFATIATARARRPSIAIQRRFDRLQAASRWRQAALALARYSIENGSAPAGSKVAVSPVGPGPLITTARPSAERRSATRPDRIFPRAAEIERGAATAARGPGEATDGTATVGSDVFAG